MSVPRPAESLRDRHAYREFPVWTPDESVARVRTLIGSDDPAAAIRFRLLGTTRLGQQYECGDLPTGRIRGLYAMLMLDSPSVVAAGRLALALWDRPPRSAAVNIRTLTSQLRQQLERIEPGLGARLSTLRATGGAPGGYRLEIRRGECDLHVFGDLSARGHAAILARELPLAARLLGAALSLWSGPAGLDLPATTVLTSRLRALNEYRISATEDYHHVRLAQGELVTLLPEIRQIVADHPFRERSWSHLLRTLYLAGDVRSALSAYDHLRIRLADELGIEPSPALRRLHVSILRGETDAVCHDAWPPYPGGQRADT